MPASVMTMPEATKAVQMYQAGHGQPEIAAALQRSRKAIRTAFRQLGVQTRDRAEAQRVRGGPRSLHAAWQPRCGQSGRFVKADERFSALSVDEPK